MAFGDYPAEYNPKVHGVYDPARYYGKAGKKSPQQRKSRNFSKIQNFLFKTLH